MTKDQTKQRTIQWQELAPRESDGLVPAIIQQAQNGQVLMLGYMDKAALQETQKSGEVTFYSRSKQRLWKKGESSNNTLKLEAISTDCDQDTLLIQAIPQGPTCHLGNPSCFSQEEVEGIPFLATLQSLIQKRNQNRPEGSYTTQLFNEGLDQIAQKLGEEATETIIAAKNSDPKAFENEAADLIYHLMALLEMKNESLENVTRILKERHRSTKKA